jgi:hypothetical protein
MPRPCSRSPAVDPSPGLGSGGLGSSSGLLPGNRSTNCPSARSVTPRPSGAPAASARARVYPASWRRRDGPGDPPGSPPSDGPGSSDWPAWSRSPRACTSPTGPARTRPARRSRMALSRPSATGRCEPSSMPSTFSRTAPAAGRLPSGRRARAAGGEGPPVPCQRRCERLMAGVQPAVRPPVRVDVDRSREAAVVRRACDVKLMHYFVPGTLGRRSGRRSPAG